MSVWISQSYGVFFGPAYIIISYINFFISLNSKTHFELIRWRKNIRFQSRYYTNLRVQWMCTFSRPPFGEVAPDVDLLRPHRDEEQEAEQVEQQVLYIVQYCFAPQENFRKRIFFMGHIISLKNWSQKFLFPVHP